MATKKKATGATPVEATKHTKAGRVNIPTAELESFAREDEREPKELLYPRDPSLDPQLIWKGKDEQDSQPLEVPAVPIYIQETIEPRALIEDLRAHAKAGRDGEEQISFFDTFEGLEFQEKVDFYQHAGKWANRMILGDSLLVMASLAEKEGLKGQVQMIYIDPPYGIKFGSNWQVSTRNRDVRDGKTDDASRQPEQVKAFRDTWELGIHSYLSYLRDRLIVARELLTDSGSLFVQIGDQNIHLVRSVLDEVFGSGNCLSLVTFKKTVSATAELLGGVNDYLLWYARDIDKVKYRQLYRRKEADGLGAAQYTWIEEPDGLRRRLAAEESQQGIGAARLFRTDNLTSQRPPGDFPVKIGGRTFRPARGYWKTNEDGMKRLAASGRLLPVGDTLTYVRYFDDFSVFPMNNLWDDTVSSGFADPKVYVVQTNTKVAERCLLMTTDPGDLVVDPTCGSGTTAFVAERWGRRWITVDTSRVALALARTRLMTCRFPYYLLADSTQGAVKEAELAGRAPHGLPAGHDNDIRKGFVCERVPHVTLKSIAQNPDIHEGMTKEEIDKAIARRADTEVLYDKSFADPKVVRVSGPFTVESLSPHRVLLTGPEDEPIAATAVAEDAGRFVDHILDNLRAAGVQNTVKGERLVFETLEAWPGVYIQAQGSYREGDKERTAAVCIGPEHGTVGTELVREAAKEAAKTGVDVLVVCGFAFEAHVTDESEQLGRLTILKAKMNPDLQMPDLLKKTGTGNLFMVFGEPDIDIRTEGKQITVEIRGVDVYDPTTGQVRSHSTDDIACWFIDTDYNGESFFVRHAYFCGDDDPYDKLKRALKADIDGAAWASLYSTTSRPFPKPSTGKIAVKVINHYGDEVLKVYEV